MPALHRFSLAGLLLVVSLLGFDITQPVEAALNSPSNTNADAYSESRIDVYWQDNSRNETGFEVHRSPSGLPGTFTLRATTDRNATSYSDTGLDPNTQYCYTVRAFETTGRWAHFSDFSDISCSTTLPAPPPPPGAPNAPSGTDAKPANSSTVDVSWTDNSPNEDGFRVERSTDGGTSFWTVGSTGPDATSFSDTGQTSEFMVCYRIVAFNGLGDSPTSNTDCTTPPRGPTNLTAAKTDQQTILVAWKDNSAHEDSYEVQRSTAEGGPFATVASVLPGSYLNYGTVSYRESAASGSIIYWYRVRATNDGGFSDFSNTAGATNDPAPPIAPSGTSATPFGGMMGIRWTDNSTNEEGFRVERSTDGGTSWVTAFTTGVNYQGFGESWFVEEQQVCYRVFSFNGMGESPPSNTACTALPAAPGPLTATAVEQGTIDLAWADNSGVEDAYQLERADFECAGGEFYVLAVLPANATSYRDTVPACGTEYIYQVRALKGTGGYSGISNQVSVTTPPAPPAPLGSMEVRTATTGVDLDPDGYTVSVDGGPGNAVGLDGVVTFTLPVGDHTVALGGVASNCAVDGANPRTATVVEGVATRVDFSITCASAGSVQVTTLTTGVDLDPNGSTVSVDGGPTQAIATNGTTTISGLLPGDHVVRVAGVAANCDVTSPNPQGFAVVAGQTAGVSFDIACAPVTQLAFASAGFYSINSNGTGVRQLTATAQASEPAWSPDGTKIAFVSYHEGAIKIYVMNADGSNPVRLTNTALSELHPTWSSDGMRIAFAGNLDGHSDIYVMNADGMNLVRLTDSGADLEPAWSPDGSKIAFRSYRDGGFSEIYVMNADGTDVVRLTNNNAQYVHDFDPAWSPDGTKLAFTSGYSPNYDIYVMNADGTNLVRVTSVGASEPTWSPDGRKIAFLNYNGDIWLVRVDGTDPAPLTGGRNPAWRP